MTYIDYLNNFNQWLETNALPVSSQLMYFRLLNIFNRAGWPEDVGVDNLRLQLMVDAKSEKTAIRARDKLVEAGFITYRKGKKGSPNRYVLQKIPCNFYSTSDSVCDSTSDSTSDSTNDSHIKTKTKTKTKEIPPGGGIQKAAPSGDPAWARVAGFLLDHITQDPSPRCLGDLQGYLRDFGPELCIRVMEEAMDSGQTTRNWKYVDSIFKRLYRDKIRTMEDWDRSEARREVNKQGGSDDGYEYL